MSVLSEHELSAALHRAVPEPIDTPGRAGQVRRRARRLRWRRLAMTSTVLLALGLALPTLRASWPSGSPGAATNVGARTTFAPGSPQSRNCPRRGCPADTIPAELRRPLTLPVLPAGARCPLSAARRFAPGGGFSKSFTAVGEGPVYLTGGPLVSFDYPPARDSAYAGSGWGGQKVIWAVDATYTGPLLLRGGQIDGGNQLRFDHYLGAVGYVGGAGDGKPYPELAYPQAPPGLRTYPSAVRMQAPGCYAIQVDGTTFSSTIVFKAQLTGK